MMGNSDQKETPRLVLTEGIDYTIESGRWVFTATYLRKRGYCCGSGCRNCPYSSVSPNPSPDQAIPPNASQAGSTR
jgi:hypothetical protein